MSVLRSVEASVRWRIGEVPRIPLPRTSVNKGANGQKFIADSSPPVMVSTSATDKGRMAHGARADRGERVEAESGWRYGLQPTSGGLRRAEQGEGSCWPCRLRSRRRLVKEAKPCGQMRFTTMGALIRVCTCSSPPPSEGRCCDSRFGERELFPSHQAQAAEFEGMVGRGTRGF